MACHSSDCRVQGAIETAMGSDLCQPPVAVVCLLSLFDSTVSMHRYPLWVGFLNDKEVSSSSRSRPDRHNSSAHKSRKAARSLPRGEGARRADGGSRVGQGAAGTGAFGLNGPTKGWDWKVPHPAFWASHLLPRTREAGTSTGRSSKSQSPSCVRTWRPAMWRRGTSAGAVRRGRALAVCGRGFARAGWRTGHEARGLRRSRSGPAGSRVGSVPAGRL